MEIFKKGGSLWWIVRKNAYICRGNVCEFVADYFLKNFGMEYDVFISCKSEDYELAEEVYQYLKDNDVNAFLSAKELRRMKEAEYMDAICEALDTSYHIVVLASSKDNVKSKWVKFEWTTFLNEMLSERKKGQIMTILKDVNVEELPIQLRHYETFTLDDYKDRLVHYVETPAYLKRKEEARLEAERKAAEKRAMMEAEKRKEGIRSEIKEREADYVRFKQTLDGISANIIEKRKELGDCVKKCPVCEHENAIENSFCIRCGWTFVPQYDINPKGDKDHLFAAKSVWNGLQKRIQDNEETLRKHAEEFEKSKAVYEDKLADYMRQIENARKEKSNREERVKVLEGEKTQLNSVVDKLENEIYSKVNFIAELEEKLKQSKMGRMVADDKTQEEKECETKLKEFKTQAKSYYKEKFVEWKKLSNDKKYYEALTCLVDSAEGDYSEALSSLTYEYYKGTIYNHNIELAERYARRGANLDYVDCQLWLGQILRDTNRKEEALLWFRKSGKNNGGSAFLAGEMYENGEGTPKNIEQAIKWYRISAKSYWWFYQKKAEAALIRLNVNVYEEGEFMKLVHTWNFFHGSTPKEMYDSDAKWWPFHKDPRSFSALLYSAEQGYPYAQEKLGEVYVSRDARLYGFYNEEESKKWLAQASVRSKKYVKELEAMAQKKDISAIEELGDIYRCGKITVKKDNVLAEKYYRKGAELGNDSCQLWLGQLLRVDGRKKEALQWFMASGEQGQGWAAYLAGEMYEKGDGVEKSISKAVEWYRKSAKTSNTYASNARSALKRLGYGE